MVDKQTYLMVRKYLWLVPLIVGFLIALFSPLDVLKYSFSSLIVAMMSSIVPMINRISGQYELAQVAQLYFSVMWLLAPLTYLSIVQPIDESKLNGISEQKNLLLVFACLVIIPASILVVFIFGPNPADYDSKLSVVLHTRFGMAIYGFFLPHGAAALFRLSTAFIKYLFKRENHGSR